MAATLFYVDAVPGPGALAVVDGDEGFHAATVRRIRPGESLTLSDGAGTLAECVVEAADKRSLTVRVLARSAVPAPHPTVTVVQAIPKSDRSELAIELATEAGADAFFAWQAERCVARWDGDRAEKGLRRWRAVARSAARQSRRPHIPPVTGPLSGRDLAALITDHAAAGAVALILHESAEHPLNAAILAGAAALVLVVGPEGGINDDELQMLQGCGAAPVRMGPGVLRTSTAAAVALGAIGVLTPRWR